LSEPEAIKYRPISVRDALTEMKDLSEIMIDLAYSAALFHSKDLAEEVLELEERVDYLTYMLHMNVMLAARDAEDAEQLVGIATVASATNEISDAAADSASLVLKNIGVHPVIREAFEQMEEHLIRVRINPESILFQKKLKDLDLAARIGVDIIAIRKGKKWIIDPTEGVSIGGGDVIFARGAPLGIDKLYSLAIGLSDDLDSE
jgi:uncharacterized protein with PhoU and TrkA domain